LTPSEGVVRPGTKLPQCVRLEECPMLAPRSPQRPRIRPRTDASRRCRTPGKEYPPMIVYVAYARYSPKFTIVAPFLPMSSKGKFRSMRISRISTIPRMQSTQWVARLTRRWRGDCLLVCSIGFGLFIPCRAAFAQGRTGSRTVAVASNQRQHGDTLWVTLTNGGVATHDRRAPQVLDSKGAH
jgi:hypothetical protein